MVQGTVPVVWNGQGDLLEVWDRSGTLGAVWDGLGDPRRGPGWVGVPSGRSRTGRGKLEEVRDG